MVEIGDWEYGDEPETPYIDGYIGGGTVLCSVLLCYKRDSVIIQKKYFFVTKSELVRLIDE